MYHFKKEKKTVSQLKKNKCSSIFSKTAIDLKEVRVLCSLVGSNHNSSHERALEVEAIIEQLNAKFAAGGFEVSDDTFEKYVSYLSNLIYTPGGKIKTGASKIFTEADMNVLSNLKEVRFVNIKEVNSFSQNTAAVYRLISSTGQYFDYYAAFNSAPVVVERSSLTKAA